MNHKTESLPKIKSSNRLHAKVVGGRLIISIGVDTLAFAAEECDGNPKVKILDANQLALDVISELENEDEVGSSMLTDLFDAAVTAAMENGSVAFSDTDNICVQRQRKQPQNMKSKTTSRPARTRRSLHADVGLPASAIVSALKQEIAWHKKRRGYSGKVPAWEYGFIDGLYQSLKLTQEAIRQSNCKSCRGTITKGATECPHCLATDF